MVVLKEVKVAHEVDPRLKEPAEKEIEFAKKSLVNSGSLEEKERFRLAQMLEAVQRLQLLQEIESGIVQGKVIGFSDLEMSGMNAAAFLLDNAGELQSFIDQTRKRLEIK